ncbi:hypothetical protein Pfo_022816 [Paulownia fortunei]|nr:hypothetical protein Pfo_022816 [Paulownia fortunei]
MGIWEFIGSTAEAVKRDAPDATPVKNACRNSYTCGSAAFTNIDQAVRVNGLYRLGQWVPDDETKSKMGMYTTKFAKNAGLYALQEGYKLIPGGVAFSNILSKTLNDVNYENLEVEKLKVVKEKVGTPQKHFTGGRKLIDGMHGRGGVESVSNDGYPFVSATDKNPEDVIRIFMMKEFFGTRFLDDLMVHELARGKGKKPE